MIERLGPERTGPECTGPECTEPEHAVPQRRGPERYVLWNFDIPRPVRERLHSVRGFVFDPDGTLVLGDRNGRGLFPLPGALEITRWAARQGLPFVVFPNGTTKTPRELAQALRGIGFDLPDQAVMTPASSAATVLTRRGHRRVLVLGPEGLAAPMRDAGLDVVQPSAAEPRADAVLVGRYPDFTIAA